MAFQTAPAWMENSDQHHAVIYRQFARMVTSGASGVVDAGSLAVTEKAGTADMSVDVAAGGAYVPSTRSIHQGTYPVWNDAVINVPITASHPTNDRIDRILVQVRDSAQDVALTQDDNTILVVEGTPASVPTLPPITVDDWIELARVLVPAGASSITDGEITDVRQVAVQSGWHSLGKGTEHNVGAFSVAVPEGDWDKLRLTLMGRTDATCRIGLRVNSDTTAGLHAWSYWQRDTNDAGFGTRTSGESTAWHVAEWGAGYQCTAEIEIVTAAQAPTFARQCPYMARGRRSSTGAGARDYSEASGMLVSNRDITSLWVTRVVADSSTAFLDTTWWLEGMIA